MVQGDLMSAPTDDFSWVSTILCQILSTSMGVGEATAIWLCFFNFFVTTQMRTLACLLLPQAQW
jgi:hypothetical protein